MSFLKKLLGTKKEEKATSTPKPSDNVKDRSTSKCPHCSSVLEKRPSRKAKCPSCEQYIYVRKGKFITESQKNAYQFAQRFEHLGVTIDDFNNSKAKLTQEWGNAPGDNDVFWRILNVLITKQKDPNNLISIYEEMGKIAKAEGKDAASYYNQVKKIQARMNRQQLIDHKNLKGYVTGVRISAIDDNHTCSYCRDLDGRVYTLDQALEDNPLPGKCSSESICRCIYIAIFEGED